MSGTSKTEPKQTNKKPSKKADETQAPVIAPGAAGGVLQLEQPGTPPQPAPASVGVSSSQVGYYLALPAPQSATQPVGQVQATLLETESLEQVQKSLSALLETESNVTSIPDVEVLFIEAVPLQGFYRAGRFWPHEGVNVFVSDDPEGDNKECEADDGTPIAPFISTSMANVLKGERKLRVTTVPTVTTDTKEE